MAKAMHVAIIGGGRWAQVLASVALKVLPEGTVLWLCSPSNPAAWERFIETQGGAAQTSCKTASQNEIFTESRIRHVLIARAARDHAKTAMGALGAGKQVFVEKPFADNLADAKALLTLARPQQCITGLVFRYSQNLRVFSEACVAQGEINQINMVWSDPAAEHRHGALKTFDAKINVAWDVFPHVWSILKLFTGFSPAVLQSAGYLDNENTISARLGFGEMSATVQMRRNADARQRLITVIGQGWRGEIDFAQEPGGAQVAGRPLDVATGFSSPLARELSAFFGIAGLHNDALCDVAQAIEALALADEISRRL